MPLLPCTIAHCVSSGDLYQRVGELNLSGGSPSVRAMVKRRGLPFDIFAPRNWRLASSGTESCQLNATFP